MDTPLRGTTIQMASPAPARPPAELCATLAKEVALALRLPAPPAPADDLFAAGLSSLSATRLVMRLRAAHAGLRYLPARTVHLAPTLALLEAAVAAELAAA